MREGSIVEFVKISWGPDVEGLKAEVKMLHELHDIDRVRIPRVLGSIAQEGWSAIRLESLEGYPPAHGNLPIGKVVDALVALRWSLNGRGVTHGDFRPWNLLDGPKVGVIDWEHARSEFRPGEDLLDYLEAVQRRWTRLPLSQVIGIIQKYGVLCGLDVDGLIGSARDRGLIAGISKMPFHHLLT
jgi:aminoglycoside phosphotransferase